MRIDLSQQRALLKVSGADATNFLQNQLSNDIATLTEKQVQTNAFCQHQGRIIALLRVFRLGDDYYLDLPRDLLPTLIQRLQMFVLMSQVELTDVSDELVRLALIDEQDDDALRFTPTNFAQLLIYQKDEYRPSQSEKNAYPAWQKAMIEHGLAEVELTTTDLFIPQMLNLDLPEIGGVSFKKGCYPGQEVVARLHYLGKAKRRLKKCKTVATNVNAGDILSSQSGQSLKKSGIIVSAVANNGGSLCLATIDLAQMNQTIVLNGGEKVEFIGD